MSTQTAGQAIKLPVKLELEGGFWWLRSADHLIVAKLYYIARQQVEPKWIATALNSHDALVAACEKAVEAIVHLTAAVEYLEVIDAESGERYAEAATDADKLLAQLRAAIEKGKI